MTEMEAIGQLHLLCNEGAGEREEGRDIVKPLGEDGLEILAAECVAKHVIEASGLGRGEGMLHGGGHMGQWDKDMGSTIFFFLLPMMRMPIRNATTGHH